MESLNTNETLNYKALPSFFLLFYMKGILNCASSFSTGLLEQPSESTKGGVLGATFQCLIAEQFRRLRVGDRFWHENGPDAKLDTHKTAFTACQLKEIRKTSLAKVICSNSDNISAIPKNVLSLVRGFVKCDELPDLNLEAWGNSFECKQR